MTLPRSTVVTLGGKQYHTAWLGDDDPTDPVNNRYGLIGPKPVPYAGIFYSQPTGSIDIATLAAALSTEGWAFFSATGEDYDSWDGDPSGPSRADFEVSPDVAFLGTDVHYPWLQHAVLCDITSTHRAGGQLAIYGVAEYAQLAVDVAGAVGATSNDVVVLVVDGTGSFDGSANAEISAFLAGFGTEHPGNSTRLVVTRFSDYPHSGADSDYGGGVSDIPAYRVGTWTGIDSAIAADVLDAIAFPTGSGGDDIESQFEGIWAGMRSGGLGIGPGGTAEGCTGDKAIVVYTDAASSVGWLSSVGLYPLRRYPPVNNGGSGPTRHYPRAVNRRAGGTY